MGLIERALARQAGADGDGEQLRELAQFGIGLRVMNALSRVDDRALGTQEHVRRLGHRFRVRSRARAQRGRVGERLGDLVLESIVRNLDDDRLRAAVAQLRERPPEDVGNFGSNRDRLGVLGDSRHLQRGVEVEGDMSQATRVAGRQHQDRH